MPQIEVARLTESNPEVVDQLNVLIPQLKPAWDPVTVAGLARLIDSPTRVYVARCDGAIVGVTLLVPHHHLPGLRCHVEDVVVCTELRRQGIARRLVSAAMDDAPDEVISFDLRSHSSRRGAARALLGCSASRPATPPCSGGKSDRRRGLLCHPVDQFDGSVSMPRSSTSRHSEIMAARSPSWKNHWVWAAWITPWAAAASIVGIERVAGQAESRTEELGDHDAGCSVGCRPAPPSRRSACPRSRRSSAGAGRRPRLRSVPRARARSACIGGSSSGRAASAARSPSLRRAICCWKTSSLLGKVAVEGPHRDLRLGRDVLDGDVVESALFEES